MFDKDNESTVKNPDLLNWNRDVKKLKLPPIVDSGHKIWKHVTSLQLWEIYRMAKKVSHPQF